MCEWLRRFMLKSIEETGRAEGAPIVNFPERVISTEEEDIYVGRNLLERLLHVSAFYLALPPNTYGVVVFPDGTSHELEGKLYKVPAGVYTIYYVDKRERTDLSGPVSEITTDNEKLTLQVILRYHVENPVLALSIVRPIETLMEHIETDVAQYIRTHDHSEIADPADNTHSRLFSFFSERHKRRTSLSDAISITGIELKEFTGDREYVEMRRKVRMDERQTQLIRQQEEHQQEINRLKAQFKAENDKQAAEQKAVIGTMEAMHEKEKKEILHQVELRKIELEDKRQHWQRQYDKFAKAFDAVSQAVSGGYLVNPNALNTVLELVQTLKDEIRSDEISSPISDSAGSGSPTGNSTVISPPATTDSDKVEKLTNTLLNLLNPKK